MAETGDSGSRRFSPGPDQRQIPFDPVPVSVGDEKAEAGPLPNLFIGRFFPIAVSADHRPGNFGQLVQGGAKVAAVDHVIRLNFLHDPG
jgi:hypothetical protein